MEIASMNRVIVLGNDITDVGSAKTDTEVVFVVGNKWHCTSFERTLVR